MLISVLSYFFFYIFLLWLKPTFLFKYLVNILYKYTINIFNTSKKWNSNITAL